MVVEAAGQLIRTFRYGLDYSFTCASEYQRHRGERVVDRKIHPSTPWPE